MSFGFFFLLCLILFFSGVVIGAYQTEQEWRRKETHWKQMWAFYKNNPEARMPDWKENE